MFLGLCESCTRKSCVIMMRKAMRCKTLALRRWCDPECNVIVRKAEVAVVVTDVAEV